MQTTEITIIDQVKEMEIKSGAQFSFDLIEVSALANRATAIVAPCTDKDFEEVATVRKGLAKYRKDISSDFMDARSEFNRLSKGVIEVQNMVLDTFTPEEDRMKAFEKVRKEAVIREARLEAFPAKLERLEAIGDGLIEDQDAILAMEDADFEIYIVGRQSDKNEADRLANEEARLKMEDDAKAAADALALKAQEANRIEAARLEERRIGEEKLEIEKNRLQNEKNDMEIRRVQEEADRVSAEERRVQAEVIAKAKAEAQRVATAQAKQADENYQAWLKSIEYDETTMKLLTLSDGTVQAYKLVSTYKA